MIYGIDQPSRDVACALFKVLYHAPTIRSASHESGTYGRNADLDESDAGIGIVVLRSRTHDDDGLAGFDHRKTFPDRCYDWPSRDRPSRRGVVREMDRCPRPQLMIVGQCRQGLEREFLWIDQVSVCQPVIGRHHQLFLLLKQDRALHQAVMGQRKSADRRIHLAYCNCLKLVQQRKFHPFDIDMEFAPEMPDKWQGQLIKSATEETDPQPVCLTKGGLPAIVQRGAENQGSGFYAETKLLAEGRQSNTPARSYEELPSHLFLQ
jgi:hypothetical protein